MFGSVCSIFGISLNICRCSCSHSSGYSGLSERLTTFFVDSRTVATLIFPSLLIINSTILPYFHESLGKSSLSCAISSICGVSFASILVDFSFSANFSRGSIGNHFARSSKVTPVVFVLFSIYLTLIYFEIRIILFTFVYNRYTSFHVW